MPEPHERLAALYQGRTDCYGLVHGQCVHEPLTLSLWYQHVHGNGSVGVYPLLDDGTVHWGCVDIDEGFDLINIAINIWKVLKALGITSWVERSKGKGFHTLVFCEDWVPADDMRRSLQLACQVAGYHPKEINPKQTSLAPGQKGNYLNAAYAHDWWEATKRMIVDLEMLGRPPIGLLNWLDRAEASLNAPSVIANAAALYKPARASQLVVWDDRPSEDLAGLTGRLRGVTRALFFDGPLPSLTTGRTDRSSALQRLAHLLFNESFTASEALALVRDLDERLEKYVGRADAELQYQRIVEKAYQ